MLDPRYDHLSVEPKIYELWEKSGFFKPQTDADCTQNNAEKTPRKSAFCIVMPPPNANGSLHIGHAVFATLEDIMIRFARMQGKKALWLPGADHAGFETQVVFEKKLEKEGTSRFAILQEPGGREKLYKMIYDFTQANKKVMENQLRRLGASCDWSREMFTLDPRIVKTVYETFERLYKDGLVYRDKRIVNWCVKHQTSLSDLEVSWENRTDKLYFVRYKIAGKKDEYITVATTRPETIPGDTAIAINPKDKKYTALIGEHAVNPLTKEAIPIIADDAVDMNFGTGALKITPAHDAADFEIGKRHGLQTRQAIGTRGEVLPVFGTPEPNPLYNSEVPVKISEARAEAEKILRESNAIPPENGVKEYVHQVATCYKCKNTLEPMLMEQWFVDLTKNGRKKIVEPAIAAVKTGKIKIVPKYQEKIFFHWMNNIRDWNISRQIVWGIRIPAWYRNKLKVESSKLKVGEMEQEIYVGTEPPKGKGWVQNTDVFDTWFSSGQWPFATLLASSGSSSKLKAQSSKLSDASDDFKAFYPTSVMETGADILFFWVARMIMLGIYKTGKIPFKTVFLHGLVRDKDRQKMSKSKGNVIDPLGVAEEYGTDALRMALVSGNAPGTDIIISEEKIKGYRNFATKIWNIARFILLNKPADQRGFERGSARKNIRENLRESAFSQEDKKNIAALQKIKVDVAKNIEKFEFHLASETIYRYIWHEFADKIIEDYKPRLADETKPDNQIASYQTLETILLECLKMLHPFMPFVTEEIYQKFRPGKILMAERW